MKTRQCNKVALVFSVLLILPLFGVAPAAAKGPGNGTGGGNSATETYGNNLSFPVIWAEGVTKILRGTPGMTPELNGEYWYQWGTNGVDPNVTPASCPPDPDENDPALNPSGQNFCDDGVSGQLTIEAGTPAAANPLPLAKAYLQKDPLNTWQAGSADWSNQDGVPVDWIDWGDSLESVDWYTRSQVRIEVVLFKDLETLMTEYEMRHTNGWGIDEVHGLATTPEGAITDPGGLGTQATIYSPCARLTIQKLLVDREDPNVSSLIWNPTSGEWTGAGVINPSILNQAVHEAGDGTGYYTAEINVKGRIIYGYTWSVRQLNDMAGETAAGDYRITFSLDETCGTNELNIPVQRNTSFDTETAIIVPLEEELVAAALAVDTTSTDEGGGVPKIDILNKLTYIDVSILERTGSGGGRR